MINIIWISLGAMIGANLRYMVNLSCAKYLSSLPVGTLIINVSGSFLLGLFVALTFTKIPVDPKWHLFFAVGFCGAYTTFSGFSLDTFMLMEQKSYLYAAVNVLLNNTICLFATAVGIALARGI